MGSLSQPHYCREIHSWCSEKLYVILFWTVNFQIQNVALEWLHISANLIMNLQYNIAMIISLLQYIYILLC